MMKPIKVGFVLLSKKDDPIPSTRIAALNMFPYLRAENFEPEILFEPERNTETPDLSGVAQEAKRRGIEIVFFQKVYGASVLACIEELRAASIKTVYGVCDVVEAAMAQACDATVTVTDFLKSLYPRDLQENIATVHDGVEHPDVQKADWGAHEGSRARPLNAVLVTSAELDHLPVLEDPPHWLHVTIIGKYAPPNQPAKRLQTAYWLFLKQHGWRNRWRFLRFLMNPRIKRQGWHPESVYTALQQADIGIIPIETNPERGASDRWLVKSENRLTLKMAVGLPVIASPIPSYVPVVDQGRNAYLAQGKAEWLRCLSALRDPATRRRMGLQARTSALAGYSMERQAERLIAVLRRLVPHDSHAEPCPAPPASHAAREALQHQGIRLPVASAAYAAKPAPGTRQA